MLTKWRNLSASLASSEIADPGGYVETPREAQGNGGTITDLENILRLFGPNRNALDTFLVFRGQVERHTKFGELNPSIFRYGRETPRGIEEEVYSDFYNLIRNHGISRDMHNPWEFLCYAQHIGVPTRLLDWTINPLIATYFAVEDAYNSDKDGVLYVLNVTSLDPIAEFNTRLGFRGNSLEMFSTRFDFLSHFGPVKPNGSGKITSGLKIIQPPIIDARIQAQSALFSVNLDDDAPHDIPLDNHLATYTIPQNDKATIKTQLYRMGIHAASIYPDVSGIGRYLTDRRDREHWAHR